MRRANMISGTILAVLGVAVLAFLIPAQIEAGPPGMMSPRLVPQMMMGLIVALSVLLVVRNALMPDDGEPHPVSRDEYLALARIGGVFGLAVALYYLAGPLAAGIALVLGTLLALGERRIWMLVLMPAGLLGGIWFLFYRLLGAPIL